MRLVRQAGVCTYTFSIFIVVDSLHCISNGAMLIFSYLSSLLIGLPIHDNHSLTLTGVWKEPRLCREVGQKEETVCQGMMLD